MINIFFIKFKYTLTITIILLLCLIFIQETHANNYSLISERELEEKFPKNSDKYFLINNELYLYEKPSKTQFLTYPFGDLKVVWKETIKKENHLKVFGIVAATAGLVAIDQKLLDESQKLGDQIGIPSKTDNTKAVLSINEMHIRAPTDLGSSLYYIGNGWTLIAFSGSYLGYGLVSNNNRALQTSSQLMEAFITEGISVQIIKHITGRSSPTASTEPGGTWTPFPDPIEYNKNTPKYDAVPSGHMATATAALTVISLNYPEYKFINPLGYTLLTLLGFQMMNNGVHWASDYPIAIAIGYVSGKIAVNRGRKKVDSKKGWHNSIDFTVITNDRGTPSYGISYKY